MAKNRFSLKRSSKAALNMCLALACVWLSSPASATQLVRFSFTGDVSAEWTLSQSPTPDFFVVTISRFDDVPVVLAGQEEVMTVFFQTANRSGGFRLNRSSGIIVSASGDQLFTGDTSAPTFKLGSFKMTGSEFGSRLGTGTLTITAVPEPVTWAMMIGGFGLIGAASRRRTRTNVTFA